jgi:hypothetical protein
MSERRFSSKHLVCDKCKNVFQDSKGLLFGLKYLKCIAVGRNVQFFFAGVLDT